MDLSYPSIRLQLPITLPDIGSLKLGQKLLLSGELYTARDKAHARLCEMLRSNQPLPFDLSQISVFYCGPSPKPIGRVCGAIGPTTSSRMDAFTPCLIEHGLRCMIGKGDRSAAVTASIKQHGAIYLCATGGISALLSRSVVSCETFVWEDLGTEAIYRIVVQDFPCYVHTV